MTAADVVAVRTTAGPGGEEATGFRVGGAILTVAHALPPDARPGRATVGRVGSPGLPARLAARDDVADLAVLGTSGIRASRGLATDWVRAPSRPAADGDGGGWRVLLRRDGRVVDRAVTLRQRITARVDAPGSGTGGRRPALALAVSAAPGDSGAPVVDGRGRLVGVLFGVSERQRGTAYAVTARPVVTLLAAARGG
ncbi:S1 family peptidase [Patulibacter americanus]|uniref:S1 family peptidase n=1 Tax=Patulibacter americanus TaxID=588672 RepID=UPI0003B33BF3|nr:serine protease [Patulibacter americanus]